MKNYLKEFKEVRQTAQMLGLQKVVEVLTITNKKKHNGKTTAQALQDELKAKKQN